MDIITFSDNLTKALGEMADKSSAHAILQTATKVNSFIKNGGGDLEQYFGELLGHGSYKQAYQIGDICIKFAKESFIIENEMLSYSKAAEYGVQYFFCPTYFIKLPDGIRAPLTRLAEQGSYTRVPDESLEFEYLCEPHNADYLIIQPLVDVRDLPNSDAFSDILVLQDGQELSIDEYSLIEAPVEWRQSIIKEYGDLAYRDLVWALKRLKTDDLRWCNVGWFGDAPVIIDWLTLL